jgi:hypothetical protein
MVMYIIKKNSGSPVDIHIYAYKNKENSIRFHAEIKQRKQNAFN